MATNNSLISQKSYADSRLKALVRFTSDKSGIPAAINILRGAAWFETLRTRLGQDSAYGVGKRVQPHTYRPRAGHQLPQHHNLWAKYARGAHLPGKKTLAAANQLVPEAGAIMAASAWNALDTSTPLGDRGDHLLRRLRLGVQQAVFDPRRLDAGDYVRRDTPVRPVRMLEGQADLDGVAALVILLREANECGDLAHALEIGRSLYSALLTATTSTPLLLIASELFEYFNRIIFPLASDAEVELDLEQDDFHEQRLLLIRTFLQLEDAGRFKYEEITTRAQRAILSGRYGFDLLFGLGPRWRLTKPPDQVSKSNRRFVASMDVAREWGLETLRSGQRMRLMPDEIWDRMDAAH